MGVFKRAWWDLPSVSIRQIFDSLNIDHPVLSELPLHQCLWNFLGGMLYLVIFLVIMFLIMHVGCGFEQPRKRPETQAELKARIYYSMPEEMRPSRWP